MPMTERQRRALKKRLQTAIDKTQASYAGPYCATVDGAGVGSQLGRVRGRSCCTRSRSSSACHGS